MAGKKDFSTIGGYHYTFLDQCLSKYECPICLLVMREPHIVSCCGKKFCKACMDKIPEKKCPICAQPFTSMQEKELERQILDLKVKCCTENCDWVGELRDISFPFRGPVPTLSSGVYPGMWPENEAGRPLQPLSAPLY